LSAAAAGPNRRKPRSFPGPSPPSPRLASRPPHLFYGAMTTSGWVRCATPKLRGRGRPGRAGTPGARSVRRLGWGAGLIDGFAALLDQLHPPPRRVFLLDATGPGRIDRDGEQVDRGHVLAVRQQADQKDGGCHDHSDSGDDLEQRSDVVHDWVSELLRRFGSQPAPWSALQVKPPFFRSNA
jgi:hypothetical protein